MQELGFKPVNINPAVIEEHNQQIRALQSDLDALSEIFMGTQNMVLEEGEMADRAEEQVEQSVAHTKKSVCDLRDAAKSQKTNRRIVVWTAIGTIGGGSIGLVGFIGGPVIGAITTAAGAAFGGGISATAGAMI